jgi:catecholate siderophore receptor
MSDRSHIASDSTETSPRFSTSLAPAAVAALVNSIMLASTASAQSSDPSMLLASADTVTLDKLTVQDDKAKPLSSPKFTQELVNTPQTIVVVPSLVIEQQGAQNLSDVLRNTPGITFTAGEGGNVASGDAFTMRGTDTSSSIFVDGVRDTGAYSRDTFNLQQVEIAKGPAGADNGRGGSSGYVNLSTKTPVAEALTSATLSYGTADRVRGTLDINQPLDKSPIEGTAFRVNALWQDGGVVGRDYVENSSWGLSPSLALGLGTPTRITIAATLIEQENVPDSGLPIVAVPGGPLLPPTVPALTAPVDQENFYGLADSDFENVEQQRVTAKIEHDFTPDLKLTQQFTALGTDRDARTTYIQSSAISGTNPLYFPADQTVVPRNLRAQQHNEIYASLTNLFTRFATGSITHELSSGIDLTREKQRTPTWVAVNTPTTSLFSPNPNRIPTELAARAGNGAQSSAQVDTAAFYVFDTIRLSPKWLINGSVRLDHYKIDYLTVANTGSRTELGLNDDLLSWKAGVVFKPVSAGSLYAAYGNSLTPPGSGFALSSAATNQNNPLFDPQETHNFEAGVKWDFFKSALSTNLAVYRSETLNGVSTDALTGQITQDIEQIVQGVEFGVSGKLSARWLVFGGIGYTDSELKAAGTTSAANDGAGLRFTPRLSGNLWTTYILPFGLTIGGGARYSDSVSRSTANSVAVTNPTLVYVPSFWVFDAMAEYALTKNTSLRLNAYNLADEDYFRLNNNGGRYYPGAPRSWQLTAVVKF